MSSEAIQRRWTGEVECGGKDLIVDDDDERRLSRVFY